MVNPSNKNDLVMNSIYIFPVHLETLVLRKVPFMEDGYTFGKNDLLFERFHKIAENKTIKKRVGHNRRGFGNYLEMQQQMT